MFSDDVLMSRDFNPIAFLKHTMHLPNLDQEYSRLQRCSDEIDNRIRSAVAEHSVALLAQVHTTTKIVNNTEKLQSHLSALSSSCTRLHHTIEIPYDIIQRTGVELRHTTAALDTARTVQKLLSAVLKLPTPGADLHRTAKKLKEVNELLQCDNLAGIHVVDRAMSDVATVSSSVRTRSQNLLLSGLTSMRQTDILIALQCLASLGSLTTVFTNHITVRRRDTLKVIMMLDAQTIASEMAEKNDVNMAKECLFSKLETTFKEITSMSQLIMLLLKCLSQKTNPIGGLLDGGAFTHQSGEPDRATLLDTIQGGPEMFADYSTSISLQLLEKMSKLNKKNNIRGVLITEYPRLYRCVCGFVETCSEVLDLGQVSRHQFLNRALEDCKRHFETHVLEQQRDKLHNIITKMNTIVPRNGEENKIANVNFSSSHHDWDHRRSDSSSDHVTYSFTTYSAPPQATPIDTRPLLKIISYGLNAGRQDPHLTLIYIETALSTLAMLLSKLQEGVNRVQISFSNNVIGTGQTHNIVLTTGHLFHIALANVSADIFTELSGTVSLIPVLDFPAVNEAYIRLKNIITSFSSFYSKVMASFAVNGMKDIWSLMSPYLLLSLGSDDPTILEKEAAAVNSIEVLCKMIMSRHLCCFLKAGTKAEETKKRVVSSLLLKTVALWCCSPELVEASKSLPSTDEHNALHRRLKSIFTILSPLHPPERASPFSKSQFRACRAYSVTNASLQSLAPLFRISRLLTERVLSVSSVNTVPYLHASMKVTLDNLVDFLANTSAVISNQQGLQGSVVKSHSTQTKQRETFINGTNATILSLGDEEFKAEIDMLISSLW